MKQYKQSAGRKRQDNRGRKGDFPKFGNRQNKSAHFDKPERAKREESRAEAPGVICGKNPVLEALRSGRTINKVLAAAGQEPGFLRQVKELCRESGVPFLQVERASLDAEYPNHRGVVALTAPFAYAELDDILAVAAEKGEAPLIVVLAGVEDPHNLGAVLRTVEGVGAHGVVIARHGAAPVNETVVQVAAGAAEYVPVARVSSLATALDELKEKGVWVCGTRMEGADVLWQADLTCPLAIVMGSEGKGLPPLVAKKCDFFVKIPMFGQINSFNVSVSCGMVLGEALRQRHS
jgi:23S rRNA (guanosine2251-2'-O)-methyltransferase